MAIRPYPEYKSKHPEYKYWENTSDAVAHILKKGVDLVAVDTETDYDDKLDGIIRYIKGNPNNYPFCVTLYDGEEAYYITKDLKELQKLFDTESIHLTLHNHKYDRHMLANIGISLPMNRIYDTMIMIHLINEEFECDTPSQTKVKSKKLKDLAYHFLGKDAHELEDLVAEYRAIKSTHDRAEGKVSSKNSVSYKEVEELNLDLMKDYACADTDFTWHLCKVFIPEMSKQHNTNDTTLWDAYKLDMDASNAVFNIERRGVKVNRQYYRGLDLEYGKEIALLKAKFPTDINLDSNKDVAGLFEREGWTWEYYTKTKEPQVEAKHLQYLTTVTSNPKIAEYATDLLRYRELVKLKDTFIKNMLEYCQKDGRVHPDFNVCPNDNDTGSTRTGRLSSSNPNFQNLPKDDKRIRKGIVPKEGYMLVEIDAAQQEYRMLAHYSRDEQLIALIKDGVDVHVGTAMLMLGLDHDTAAQREHRQVGKKLNFSIVYGLGLSALANNLGYTLNEVKYNKAVAKFLSDGLSWKDQKDYDKLLAKYPDDDNVIYYCSTEAREAIAKASNLRNTYFDQFPDIKGWLNKVKEACKSHGYIKTWGNRRRHFKTPAKENYKAPNALIQGSCGDILKVKLAELEEFLANKNTQVINTVHDSILFEVDIEEYKAGIIEELLTILRDLPFRVPMDWDAEGSTTSWADIKSLDDLDI